jgi:hypothetical protein
MKRIGVVQYGCGPVGCSVARLALQRPSLHLAGAVDTSKEKIGKDLGELIGADKTIGVTVSGALGSVTNLGAAEVVLHCTSSKLSNVVDQIGEIDRKSVV